MRQFFEPAHIYCNLSCSGYAVSEVGSSGLTGEGPSRPGEPSDDRIITKDSSHFHLETPYLSALQTASVNLRGIRALTQFWRIFRSARADEARFEQIEFNKETYEYRAFTRLKQIRYLTRTGQIDDDFFWR